MMLAALWLCAPGPQIAAQTFTTLVSFDGTDGAYSTANLIQASDGNFYGTTSGGGANSDGSVFRITPSGALTTLYSFCSKSSCSDGANPLGGLIQASDGNLYGTTELGTVFKITLSGTLTTLGGTGGLDPLAGLIQGKDGNLYGVTARGGANTCTLRPGYRVSCGTVFKITPGGTVTTLASFNQASGFAPSSPLIQATDGNFYGTAPEGGATYPGLGTVYKITPSGTLTVLHSFDGADGEKSFAALVQGSDGNLYGTTSFGGSNANYSGTVFKITLSGTLTTLHSFDGPDGSGAEAGLIQGTDGNFYGTTSGFGFNNLGTVFKITPSGALTVLHSFDGADGQLSYASLVEGSNGDLYGTTEFGANTACSEGCGTIFRLSGNLAP
ncbi:MAG: choice-of-anchor tandem repeat GloVer-containing protein [Terracidiphilus sp.]|jgi:uncharacterized repeat protein (TIGR03803 family)